MARKRTQWDVFADKLISNTQEDTRLETYEAEMLLARRDTSTSNLPATTLIRGYDPASGRWFTKLLSDITSADSIYYRPEDYGAVGNDSNVDDSIAFNAMFDAIRASNDRERGAVVLLQPVEYTLTSSVIIGDCGDQLVIEGNGAVLTTSTSGASSDPDDQHAILSWSPKDTYVANGRSVDSEADVYATNRLYMRNVGFNADGTTNTIGLRLWATYGSVIENCYFYRVPTAIFSAWALMTVFDTCLTTQCNDYAFRHESAGANNLWSGATIAFHAGNGTVYNNCRVYNQLGATSWLINTCSNLQFNNCIIEGSGALYGIHYIDNGTNDREMLISRLHGENASTGALIKIENSNDMRLHVQGCRIHQPNLCLLDSQESTTIEVYWDKQSYFGSGQYMLCNASNRITYRDCRGADFLQNSFYDLVNGDKPQIHVLSSDASIDNYSVYNPIGAPWHHKFTRNENPTNAGQYDSQFRPVPMLNGNPTSNVRQISFTPGTGHVEFNYILPTSETAITISLWMSVAMTLAQTGGDFDPYAQWLTIAHTDADHEISVCRTRTGVELMLSSGWGTANQIYRLDNGTYDLQMGYHHFAFVLNGTADPVCYFNGKQITATGAAGTRAVNNRTTLGCSYHDNDHAMNNNYGDTPAKLSVYLIAKDSSAITTLYDGGYDYDDTSDPDSADLVLSASHNFNNTTLSSSFTDASTSNVDGTFVNFAPPYTPTWNEESSRFELLNHYHEKTWHLNVDATSTIQMPWMIPGVPYEIFLVNAGTNNVTFAQDNIHNYMTSTGNYTFPASSTTWTPSSFGVDLGDAVKIKLTLINGIVYPEETVLVA